MPDIEDKIWQFWIDVGGTFTDCFGRPPDGDLVRHKLLSTGVVKGNVGPGSSAQRIFDSRLRGRPSGIFVGFELRLVDDQGGEIATVAVVGSDGSEGSLDLRPELPFVPGPGTSYELKSDEVAPIVAIRFMLGLRRDDPIPPVDLKLATTRGTNALITRRGASTALVTTRGFGDILRIGYQERPRLFDLAIRKHPPLFATSIEVDERMAADGTVIKSLDRTRVRRQLARLRNQGIDSLAICLLHSYDAPQHEIMVEQIAREVGFTEISTSHRVANFAKIVSRGDTTVVDAYLNPILKTYIHRVRAGLSGGRLQVMTSAGGLVDADHFVGKDSILSGPAGGAVGFARAAKSAGFERAIGFDMGGTSTDVSYFDGRHELDYETEKAGVRVVAPMIAIETVAAGGGSICGFDGVKLVVGPDSAGADPGPACYGRGGPLAVTDLNFFLGRILPDRFPFALDREAVDSRLTDLAQLVADATGTQYSHGELCDGLLQIANATMSKAIRSISVSKGRDPAACVLVAFGGAAPQHACAVARELGMKKILLHPDAGILSAYGIGTADVVRHRASGVYKVFTHEAVAELDNRFDELAESVLEEIRAEGVPQPNIHVRRALDLRYQGLDAYLSIDEPQSGDYRQAFESAHRKLYGYVHEDRAIEIVAVRIECRGATSTPPPRSKSAPRRTPASEYQATVYFQAKPHTADVFDRRRLRPGDRVVGPAIIYESTSTTVIDPGFEAETLTAGELLVTDKGGAIRHAYDEQSDPIALELFNNMFAEIAEQMGIVLRNTASSVNVKERLDFSCAVFNSAGDLVANAPHIPVHLGAMSETVKSVISEHAPLRPGDVYVTNDPYRGGSHLPDVTVVTPVHAPKDGSLLFFTASRAHHAELGGTRPGSMPPFSKSLAEEGVLIQSFKLVNGGDSRFDELATLLSQGPHPSRNPEDNLADIRAQTAANNRGARDLLALVDRHTLPVVSAYMRHIQDAAAKKVGDSLAQLPNGCHEFTDYLDDGSPIQVAFQIAGDRASIDFTGTGPALRGNLNANSAIVAAATMYVLRCLLSEEIPLNQGVFSPVELILPECLLNPAPGPTPADCPAVAGGNVETSQRIVDVLLGALGAAAASQGTMNNLLFGNEEFGYYETICGGSGATPAANGADAVQTHMTNTRLTDPEILEMRFPVRLLEFSIRNGSGGRGKRRGGDGVIRRIEFLKPLKVSLLTQRRGPHPPFGLAGGEPGALGVNHLRRADGLEEVLAAFAEFQAEAGDILTVSTPGGGGYGPPSGDGGAA